jgi:catechol 2,3-dioxygenase-like lactoylglutathione lyase family enzyme
MIKAIKFASVPVRNQDRALEFYTTKLGFRVATDQPFDGEQRWIELTIPRAQTKLVLFTPKGHEDRIGSFTGISLVADDVMATCRALAERGVHFIREPKEEAWGTSAVIADPDGNQFVISSK